MEITEKNAQLQVNENNGLIPNEVYKPIVITAMYIQNVMHLSKSAHDLYYTIIGYASVLYSCSYSYT